MFSHKWIIIRISSENTESRQKKKLSAAENVKVGLKWTKPSIYGGVLEAEIDKYAAGNEISFDKLHFSSFIVVQRRINSGSSQQSRCRLIYWGETELMSRPGLFLSQLLIIFWGTNKGRRPGVTPAIRSELASPSGCC